MSIVLATHQLAIGYAGHRVAEGLDLQLKRGRLVCLLGPNGAGKSTLLRTLCGMQAPLAGEVRLDGMAIHSISSRELARRLSVVLTDRVQVGLLSAYELVALGRYPHTGWSGRLSESDHQVIRDSIEAAGAQELAARPFDELSDGERQKVLVARALAQQPQLLVLDEVTAFLDLPRRVDIMRTLRRLAHQQGATILLSTHDLDLALRSADELWLIEKGGRVSAGLPEALVLNGRFAAAFRSEGIEFDAEAGHFELDAAPRGEIGLTGDGLAARWTGRALERIGLRVRDGAARQVRVTANGWHLTGAGEDQTFHALPALVESLREPYAGQPVPPGA